MEFFEILKVILLGIVEGITEWLPISSTGHMKLLNALPFMELKGVSVGFMDMFEYVIQLAAILAVVILFWKSRFSSFSIRSTLGSPISLKVLFLASTVI